ncbi:transglutaminase-like domain-containing protein [Arcobacter porcinus]|uniref:Transglutaminase family protein n=1 Tax=Arcobacter porcinus TaxID=1935204 RepID=A0A5C2HHH3_9BACT|nr:transglutaminase family protein [Arcobacter porcinus]OCL86504.1 Transglutaminase-like superfamily protein [Arcobacter porcinus]OCL96912.1 Transglutaminase-like superfamily protein [Aliarcobacter thereius]QEP40741.1 transglutaminase family protein [Arcobacter porcinus]
MKRRTFLKTATTFSAISVLSPKFIFANENKNPFGITKTPRKFCVTNRYEFEQTKEITQVWIPLPKNESYHEVIDIDYKGNFTEAKIVKNPYNTEVLYAKWDKNIQAKLDLNFSVIMQERTTDFSKATSNIDYPNYVKEYLKATTHIPITKKLTNYANEITKNAKTPLEKARAIYNWTVNTMYRDESVIGCGIGDAEKSIEDKIYGGKCTDISSVFVCLLRNAKIPARETFGIRAGQSKISDACGKADEKGFANITGAQHCRAEFYIDGLGWVPCDPADVTKVKLAEKLTNNDKKLKDVKEYFFGSWEMNWIAFNSARDFILEPKPTQYPLNMLGYPYAEVGEDAKDYYNPKTFSYTYNSQELL